ncbi:uncharacterized protein [Narcine bancroftii]|uniref:uncharacterized protein isoform X3 n=1 Tax=Narcine bancroftii TaxID=1343680 RepID=UPI003831EC1F
MKSHLGGPGLLVSVISCSSTGFAVVTSSFAKYCGESLGAVVQKFRVKKSPIGQAAPAKGNVWRDLTTKGECNTRYKSLLSNQAKVAENLSLKEKHCVPNTAWRNCIALHNLRQSTKVPLDDVHRRERSMESEVLMEKNSSNNVPIAGIYSAADETAKLCAKATNVNCDIFLGKANTENNFSIRKQMIQTQGLSPIIVNEGKTSEAVHDDDESISVNSGEDDRETVTCDECTEMFWKVINKKEPRKRRRELDKKSPYDPASLACDQWILKKPLVRDNLHKYRREIESSIKYLKSLAGFAQAKDTVKWIPQCSRPHVFLHRSEQFIQAMKLSCSRSAIEIWILDFHTIKIMANSMEGTYALAREKLMNIFMRIERKSLKRRKERDPGRKISLSMSFLKFPLLIYCQTMKTLNLKWRSPL